MNAADFMAALWDSITLAFVQKHVMAEVFQRLTEAKELIPFIVEPRFLAQVRDEAHQLLIASQERIDDPKPTDDADTAIRRELRKVATHSQREAMSILVERILSLCLSQTTDFPIRIEKISQALMTIGVPPRTASIRSLNARLARMRKAGFQQAEKHGRGRRRASENLPTGEPKDQGPWLPVYDKLLRIVLHDTPKEPAQADRDPDASTAKQVIALGLMNGGWVKRYLHHFRTANPDLAKRILGD
jgi:hypothetical protein